MIWIGLAFAPGVAPATEFHVAPSRDDAGKGTLEKPFRTLTAARDAIRRLKQAGPLAEPVNVVVHGGTYYLDQPFTLTADDAGSLAAPIIYRAAEGERPILSGGRVFSGWKNLKDNLWTVELPEVKAGRWYFRQLFADGRRLTRARTPNEGFFTTAGPLSKYAALGRFGGYQGVGKYRRENPEVFCGFQFAPEDAKWWTQCPDAEVITFHSWECSWQTVRRIDAEKHDVYFNTPCRYPVGFYSPHLKYRIENVPEALDAPGEWYLDRRTGVLSYLAKPGEDPRKMAFVAPVLQRLVVLEGSADRPIEHVRLVGLSLQHADYPLGIYDVARDWPTPVLKAYPGWPTTFPPGYTDAQAAPLCGQVVELWDAAHCAIEDCEIAHVGNYAIKVFERGHHNRIVGCLLHDLGGGGVMVGIPVREVEKAKVPRSDAPSHLEIANNVIRDCGLVHPAAVGILIMQSHHNRITHNEINNVGYGAINVGWTWGRPPNYTDHNLVEGNHIHHVLRDLADNGGIYTLGINEGTVFRENYIHDVLRGAAAVGAANNGIFFDEGSQGILVERNVFRRLSAKPTRHNRNSAADHTWGENDFGDQATAPDWSESVIQQAGPEPQYRPKLERWLGAKGASGANK
ncbi:MAG: right-handed parallel beta-helix repeat-containing protein [Thermoguttaceae bacterium]|jgi:hypothetical protein